MATTKRKNLIARCMRAIGYLTDPATTPGKVFAAWEKEATAVMERLARHDLYLDATGRAMEQAFRFHAQSNKAVEGALQRMRLPTITSLVELHEELRLLADRVDAVGARLDAVVDLLERMERGRGGAGA